jgi:AcrR family transcriptional regulator
MAEAEALSSRTDEAITVALELFLEHGYDNTPMSLIARKLGLTKAGVYHYFESKEMLLYKAHKRAMERQFIPLLDAADNEPDPERRLRQFLFNHARMLALEPTAGILISEARRLSPEHLQDVQRTWRRVLKIVRDAIVELQKAGRCSAALNPTYAAFTAIGMVSWIPNWFDAARRKSVDVVAATMAGLFVDGLLTTDPERWMSGGTWVPQQRRPRGRGAE